MKYLALHLGLIMESHLGLMIDLSCVLLMTPLIFLMMVNLRVHCLVFHLETFGTELGSSDGPFGGTLEGSTLVVPLGYTDSEALGFD